MIIRYDYRRNGKLCNLCGFHSCTLLIIIYYVMCRSILKQTIKKRRFICRLSNTLAIFATNRFACGFHHRRLKGNRVQIPDSPAAVRFHVKHFNVHPLPLIIFRYIGEGREGGLKWKPSQNTCHSLFFFATRGIGQSAALLIIKKE